MIISSSKSLKGTQTNVDVFPLCMRSCPMKPTVVALLILRHEEGLPELTLLSPLSLKQGISPFVSESYSLLNTAISLSSSYMLKEDISNSEKR